MQVALPLLDREVITNFTIGCLASGFLLCHVYCFMVRTHHLDLLSRLLVYHLATCFSGTVGTRTSRLQLLLIQRELRSSTPFSIITSIGGHQFLLNMLINSTARFFLLTFSFIRITYIDMLFTYSIQFTTLPGLYDIVT